MNNEWEINWMEAAVAGIFLMYCIYEVNLDVRNKFGQYEIAEDSEHTHIHENI
jgi:hypothetical protein